MSDLKVSVAIEQIQNEIEKQLECGLCLQCFHEPKVLDCNHIYCKACLDKLLEFEVDGSASIKCPLRCEVVTTIVCNKTTYDLGTNLYVQGIVDKINEKCRGNQERGKCYEPKCDGSISVFCYNCNCLLCSSCQNKHHVKHQDNSFVSIKFDERKEAVVVVCAEHNTVADFVCFERNCNGKFICLYCLERNHKNHYNESINVKCTQIKRWLETEEDRTQEIESSIQLINNMLEMDEQSILDSRKSLECILKMRILKGLLDYFTSAQQEKIRLLHAFDSAANNHRKTYPDTGVAEFFNKFKGVEDIIVVLMEKNAIKYLAKLASAKINLPTVNIGLSDATESKALGELKVRAGPYKSINDGHDDPNFTNSFYAADKCYNVNLWNGVEELLTKDFEEINVSRSENIIDGKEVNENMKAQVDQCIQVTGETKLLKNESKDGGMDIKIVAPVDKGYRFIFIMLSLSIGILAVAILCGWLLKPRKVNGGYSEWSQFSVCTKSCGRELQERHRLCNNPIPINGGMECLILGIDRETKECNISPCPVNGGFSEWSQFSTCTKSCGTLGLQERVRFCNNPVPKYGGMGCASLGFFKGYKELQECNKITCPSSTVEFRFVDGVIEIAKRAYPMYNAKFVGYGIGHNSNGDDADKGKHRKQTSSIIECIKYCANLKAIDNNINGVQYEMYAGKLCFCEHNYTTHVYRNDHLHYKLT